MNILPCGDQSILIETDHAANLAAALRGHDGIIDIIPSATTVLLALDTGVLSLRDAHDLVHGISLDSEGDALEANTVEIPVLYDGADLQVAADAHSCSIDALISWHTSTTWRAAFGGFAPGFFYLLPEDSTAPDVPRRDSPRKEIPAGSVALAGQYSAVYPKVSPGGWQLIGNTDSVMWDIDRIQPSLIAPGDFVRFKQVR